MNASTIQRISATSALTLIFAIGSTNAAAYSWAEILIPSIGPMGVAFGLNNKGQVAVTKADGSKTGIYRGGIFTPLPAPPAGYRVSALDINDSGTIVGSAFSPSDPTHEQGFILNGSQYTFFSRRSGAGFSVTQGMNADGRISGDGRSDELGRYAFIWQQETLVGGTRQLAPFLARLKIAELNTAARGINDAGVIVGFTGSGVGFVGSDSRGYQLLIPPGGDAPGASVGCEGINNFGQVVCTVTDAAGNNRNFIGTPNANDQDDQ